MVGRGVDAFDAPYFPLLRATLGCKETKLYEGKAVILTMCKYVYRCIYVYRMSLLSVYINI